MTTLTHKLLVADVEYEIKLVEELGKLEQVKTSLPYSIRTLLENQGEINGSIYYNGFLDYLEIVLAHETSLQTPETLRGIKRVVDEILQAPSLTENESPFLSNEELRNLTIDGMPF